MTDHDELVRLAAEALSVGYLENDTWASEAAAAVVAAIEPEIEKTVDFYERGLAKANDDKHEITVEMLGLIHAAREQGKADAWDKGRASVAEDFLKPIGEDGMRPATPNPYRTEVCTCGNSDMFSATECRKCGES